MSLLKLKKPFTKPFWKLSSHRIPALSLYKTLIKTTKLFPKTIHQKYLFYAIPLDGDKQAYQHIDDLAWGRKGRLREVLDLKRVHKLVYDTRTLQSRTADPHSAYKIPLAPTLYTPPKYRIIKKIKWPKKKRPYRKVIRYTITTQLGYKLWRVRGWKQPTWISMMMNKRIIKHQKHVDKYQELLELLDIARHEQRFMRSLDPNLEEEAKGFDELVLQEMKIHKRYYDNMMKIREKTGFDD
ncbi:7139_t:CDS:2 [Entrophospora sp. SA101]|nr:7139_t:CDS:2 [Entrophospora sp. SA101]